VAHFEVSYDGNVKVTPAKPTADPRLNQILLTTLQQWRFFPDEGWSGDRLGLRPANSDNGAVSGNVTFGDIPECSNEFTITQTTVHEVQDKQPDSFLSRNYHDRERDRIGVPALV
jgi:hypothetical protein